MTNFDENDHLTVAYFMSHGRLLYKDIFSHHFPLPYYWSFLFTPLWSAASPARTISVFRLDILVLYLISFISIFLTYKNSKSRFALSLWLILLSTFFTLYHGNLVLSETFAAIFITSLFWLYLPVILGWEKITEFSTILAIIISSAAFWTQPLLFFLCFLPLLFSSSKIKTAIIIFLFNLLPLAIFFFSDQLTDFLRDGIWFNFFVYPKYYSDPNGGTFLGNQLYFFTHFFNSYQIFQFIINISFWLLFFLVICTRQIQLIIAFVLFFLSVHIREVKIIPGQPFNFGIYPLILVSTSAFCLLFIIYFNRFRFYLSIFLFLLLGLNIQNSLPIIKNSLDKEYNYHVFWSPRQDLGTLISKLVSQSQNVLIYPHDVDLYYFSQHLSLDRFVYWFPWIDAVPEFKQERMTALAQNPPAVIYLGNLDYLSQKNFYTQYFPNLTQGYTEVIQDQKHTGIWTKGN